jgi:hypothetical protein
VRLTTYHPCSAECQVFRGLNIPGPLGPSRRPVVGELYLLLEGTKFGFKIPDASRWLSGFCDIFSTSARSKIPAYINHRRQTPAHESRKRKSFTLEATKCSHVMVEAWKLTRVGKCAPRSVLHEASSSKI